MAIGGLLGIGFLLRRRFAGWIRRRTLVRPNARDSASSHEAAKLYRRMLAALRKRGIEKLAFQTAGEFAASLSDNLLNPLVNDFTMGYESVRFGRKTEPVLEMEALLRRIEALPH